MNIVFYPKNKLVKEVIPCPQTSKAPSWFKDLPNYTNGETELNVYGGQSNYSVKSCIPFMDSYLTGYTFNLWADIFVKQVDGYPYISWNHSYNEISEVVQRDSIDLPVYENFHPFNFSWQSHWGIKTPKGYSCILTQPFNRTDLPFITTTGVMDTDKWGVWGRQPFALKKDFEGIIPAGTPIIQVIPFKRETWNSSIDESLSEHGMYEDIRSRSKIRGYYKSKHWSRKEYK